MKYWLIISICTLTSASNLKAAVISPVNKIKIAAVTGLGLAACYKCSNLDTNADFTSVIAGAALPLAVTTAALTAGRILSPISHDGIALDDGVTCYAMGALGLVGGHITPLLMNKPEIGLGACIAGIILVSAPFERTLTLLHRLAFNPITNVPVFLARSILNGLGADLGPAL